MLDFHTGPGTKANKHSTANQTKPKARLYLHALPCLSWLKCVCSLLYFVFTGSALLQKLAEIWTQFYTSVLPTLQAIFIPVQVRNNKNSNVILIV